MNDICDFCINLMLNLDIADFKLFFVDVFKKF